MTTLTTRAPHPVLLAAGIALILFCMVGIAAIMGWFPSSMGRNSDNTAVVESKTAAIPEKAIPAPVAQKKLAAPVRVARTTCASCGVIETIRAVETHGTGSGVGAVGGAVVGGLLGNQVGGGHGKEAMTVVGAIGGALAGNHIEKRVNATTSYEIVVRMENGASQVITETSQQAWHTGDTVKVVNGTLRSI